MFVKKNPLWVVSTVLVLGLSALPVARTAYGAPDEVASGGHSVLWRNPADIASRDLFYGSGGEQNQPRGPFTFVEEDLDGTNPKFVVRDRDGVKWKVKLGMEARPETVASRIAWAVGYFTDYEYFVQDLQISDMPAHLHRGQALVDPDGSVHNARLKRHAKDERDIGTWHWRRDPFTGSREWNGLRVLMAVINNWDLKDANNRVFQKGPDSIYLVSDLGASFGSAGRSWPRGKAKGNLDSYSESKFIRKMTATSVTFAVPARPSFIYLVNPKEYISRLRLEWIGKSVPRGDAKWMGTLLANLSPRQIRDAFRAAGYKPQEVEGFSAMLERRIAMLRDL